MKIHILIALLLSYCHGQPRIVKRQTSPFAYALPSNASSIVSEINEDFECTGRQYGYYADTNNACHIFHVCLPYLNTEGGEEMRMWSFLCGEGTIFDQAQLLCNYPEYAFPCEDASSLYNINDYFREENVDRQFRDGLNDIF